MSVFSCQIKNLTNEDLGDLKDVGVSYSHHPSEILLLRDENNFLSLQCQSLSHIKPISIDFCSGRSIYKRNTLQSKNQNLAKAVQFQNQGDTLLDLTAGFGDDALLFASMGFQVLALERNPLMYLLLKDALKRFQVFDSSDDIVVNQRLKFEFSDAKSFLSLQKEEGFDCIYYDPMFPETKKSALSSGRLQVLQFLTQDLPDVEAGLVNLALCVAHRRVVVKRPLKAPELHLPVTHSYRGQSIRFDMYKI
ncbi:MAG: class I SAM-dependent methyltransferase [Bdellovibrionales bacterium]|nr:class I SAM-dependent methyltransferase [Bdellovibrionales bacterium]